MKFSAIFVSSTLLLSGAAYSLPSRLSERVASRYRKTQPLSRISESSANVTEGNATLSNNWAGAVLTSAPKGESFSTVVGTFTIPKPSNPSGQGDASSSAWVGIDGDTANAAILQAGIDFTCSDSGQVSFDAWYEYFPAPATDFSGFPMAVGDSVTVKIESSSPTSGTVTLENNTQKKSVSQALTAPSSSATLAGQNAEWIVEDFSVNGGLVNFANFGQVAFTDCSAQTSSQSVGLTGADTFDIQGANGDVLTDVKINSPSAVTITHL